MTLFSHHFSTVFVCRGFCHRPFNTRENYQSKLKQNCYTSVLFITWHSSGLQVVVVTSQSTKSPPAPLIGNQDIPSPAIRYNLCRCHGSGVRPYLPDIQTTTSGFTWCKRLSASHVHPIPKVDPNHS